MNYKFNEIVCLNCNKKLKREDSCFEITQTKWVNGYYTIESESQYYCQECSKDGFSITALVNGK